MLALIFDGKLALRDVAKPIAGPNEALIRVRLAGICGTDIEILKGYSAFRGVLGHEFVGEVVECGKPEWVGRRVVGEINIACGECAWCGRGLGRHCPQRTVMGIVNRAGCFAEYVALPVRNLHPIAAAVPDQDAIFVEPLAAALEILEQVHVAPGTSTVVLGDGRLGLLAAQVLANAGAEVVLLGKHEWKLQLARSWGITGVIDSQPQLPASSIPLVVEASGSPRGLEEAFRLVEPRGTVVMKSTFHDPATLAATKLVVDEVTLVGSRCGNFSAALQQLGGGRVRVQPLLTKVFPLEESIAAFEYMQRADCLKVGLANLQGMV